MVIGYFANSPSWWTNIGTMLHGERTQKALVAVARLIETRIVAALTNRITRNRTRPGVHATGTFARLIAISTPPVMMLPRPLNPTAPASTWTIGETGRNST